MDFISLREQIPVRQKEYDLIVAGGGVAGVAAALTAHRAGKRVLLIEESTILGGLATLGLINLFVPMCNGRGKQIIFGLAEEFLRFSLKYGWATIPKEWEHGEPAEPTTVRYIARFSQNIFAIAVLDFLAGTGVEILFDTIVSSSVMKGGHCEGVIVEGKSGREFIRGKIVVDATGDADVLRRSGVPTVTGGNYFTYCCKGISVESCRKAAESGNIADAYIGFSGGSVNLYGKDQPPEIPLCDATSTDQVSQFLIRNQRELFRKIKDQEPKSREIVTLPGMAQFRTSCRIDGDYTLRVSDSYRHFEDSIGAICDFERRDFLFEMPYRLQIRTGFDNLIAAGRTTSGEGYAWDVIRVIPPAIISGQAAGNAAVLAIDSGRGVDRLDVGQLQKMQAEQNVMIHFDDALVPAGRADAGEKGEDFGHI